MKQTDRGYAPTHGYLEELMSEMPELRHPSMPEYVIHEYDELLDSANMTPELLIRSTLMRGIARSKKRTTPFAAG